MKKKLNMQAVVTSQSSLKSGMDTLDLALFKADGTPFVPHTNVMPVQAASVAADVATLVTDFNALLTKLKNAGFMATS